MAVQQPAATAAEPEGQQRYGGGAPHAAACGDGCADGEGVQAGGDRFVGDPREGGPQDIPLRAVGRDHGGGLGGVPQMPFDHGDAVGVQNPVDIGVQIVIRDRASQIAHFTRRKAGRASAPVSWRNFSRPRASLDITVPTGTPRTAAVSA
jgi:hypothetical protein